MNKYNINVVDDYTIVEIDEKLYLLDTGTISMSIDKLIKINNIDFSTNFLQNNFKKQLDSTFNMNIEGIIGKDFINKLGGIEVDLINMKICFGSFTKEITNETKISNNYICKIKVNGNLVNAYLDTGAHIFMIHNKALLDSCKKIGVVTETSFTGSFNLNLYECVVEFNEKSYTIKVLEYNDKMNHMQGIDVYFGLNQFAKKYYVIDVKKGIFYFE